MINLSSYTGRLLLAASILTGIPGFCLNLNSAKATVTRPLGHGAAQLPRTEAKSTVTNDFETNTVESWLPRIGTETVAVTSVDKHSGSYSLLTSNRQYAYDGCKINVAST